MIDLEEIILLSKEVNGKEYINLKLNKLTVEEDLETHKTSISCSYEMTTVSSRTMYSIACEGDGPVEALFKGIRQEQQEKYKSLGSIRFSSFNARAKINNSLATPVTAFLTINNSERSKIEFRHESNSILRASAELIRQSIEFFINAELAAVRLKELWGLAKREDIKTKYLRKLTTIARVTSYAEAMK